MQVNSQIHGFTVLREQALPELDAVLYELTHDRTGLSLVWLRRDDDNKTFAIAFRTLPEDDTGVFHILEHSVLCGSDRYPVKEPFVELLKSSLNTFLNAMTFPDKTVYPVSSRNDKDFLNLMRVYLDAVFHPLIYSRREIFEQEGWRFVLDGDETTWQGVVFNEMKGVFADADELSENALNRALFPETPYRFVSGGDPAHIPELTYEAFLDAHRRFYSPANAYVFLDGDMDIDAVLGILDGEYLSDLERGERLPPPPIQRPVSAPEQIVDYELAPEEDASGRTRVVWGHVIARFDERERIIAAHVLAKALCGTNQSPLSRAILEPGLAEDVILSVSEGIEQVLIKMELRDLAEENRAEAERVTRQTLESLAGGLDHRQLKAVMENLEFRLRERDYGSYPPGLIYGLNVLSSWLYGGLPEADLQVGTVFDRLRAKLEEGYFESLLRELLLDNPHSAKVVMRPSHTAGRERAAGEAARIRQRADGWTEAERRIWQARQEELLAWQNTADAPEALASIPRLTLADLSREPEHIPTEVLSLEDTTLLHHPVSGHGIVYLSLYFDAEGLTEEEYSCLALYCDLIGSLATSRHTAEEVTELARRLFGNIVIRPDIQTRDDDPAQFTVKLCVNGNVLERNMESACALLVELLTQTSFDAEADILNILRQQKTEMYEAIVMAGAAVAIRRVNAQLYASGATEEYCGGLSYYAWLKEREEHWDFEALRADLLALRRRLIRRGGLALSVTGALSDTVRAAVNHLAQALDPDASAAGENRLAPLGARREGVIIPADVCFAALGGDMFRHGGVYNGVTPLMTKIVSLGYLWNVIRVQGGAYGTGMLARQTGFAGCYSYRDPNGANSLRQYLGCGAYLRQICASEEDLTGFIIGAVSDASPLLTARARGSLGDAFYWRGLDWQRRCQRREELLSTTHAQLARLADALDETLRNGGVCVVGGREQLDACGGFDRLLSL